MGVERGLIPYYILPTNVALATSLLSRHHVVVMSQYEYEDVALDPPPVNKISASVSKKAQYYQPVEDKY